MKLININQKMYYLARDILKRSRNFKREKDLLETFSISNPDYLYCNVVNKKYIPVKTKFPEEDSVLLINKKWYITHKSKFHL